MGAHSMGNATKKKWKINTRMYQEAGVFRHPLFSPRININWHTIKWLSVITVITFAKRWYNWKKLGKIVTAYNGRYITVTVSRHNVSELFKPSIFGLQLSVSVLWCSFGHIIFLKRYLSTRILFVDIKERPSLLFGLSLYRVFNLVQV